MNNGGLYFIVGGLCMIVVIGVFLFFGGHLGARHGAGYRHAVHIDLDHHP